MGVDSRIKQKEYNKLFLIGIKTAFSSNSYIRM